MTAAEEVTEFAAGAAPRPQRTAFLHTAGPPIKVGANPSAMVIAP